MKSPKWNAGSKYRHVPPAKWKRKFVKSKFYGIESSKYRRKTKYEMAVLAKIFMKFWNRIWFFCSGFWNQSRRCRNINNCSLFQIRIGFRGIKLIPIPKSNVFYLQKILDTGMQEKARLGSSDTGPEANTSITTLLLESDRSAELSFFSSNGTASSASRSLNWAVLFSDALCEDYETSSPI